MIVHKIEPQGYCGGVTHAIKIAIEATKNTEVPRPIYMLGQIIHNSHVIKDLEQLDIISIDDTKLSRLELLDKIDAGTVIFSAHGVSPKVYEKAKNKGLHIIDATCPYVLLIHNKMLEHLHNGYECLYIGTKGHPECEGVIGISDKIHTIYSIEDIDNLNLNTDKIYATNQTTLSIFDITNILQKIKEQYPLAILDDKICNATTVRQEAMASQPKADLCIVVGDKKSSNTKKLKQVSLDKAKLPTFLVEDLESLKKEDLSNYTTVNVSSGASTPDYIVDEIIEYLKRC